MREAAAAGALLQLFATPAAAERHPDLPVTHVVDDRAIEVLAGSVTPQGLVGVAPLLTVDLPAAVAAAHGLLVVLVEPRDPGNLGTIVRTADAAGAGAVVVTGDAVDPHNAKAVRASAGSLWHLPVCSGGALPDALAAARGAGLRVVAADGHAVRSLDEAVDSGELARPTAWLLGSEAAGLPPAAIGQADTALRVPLHGRAESLNLAAAAAVCLYSSTRAQRWHNPDL